MSTAVAQRLPIEYYMFTDQQRELFTRAQGILIHRCMARFGFDYTLPRDTAGYQPKSLTELRYGITSAADASDYGYRPRNSQRKAETPAASPMSAQMLKVLNGSRGRADSHPSPSGTIGTLEGIKIPAGGCVGEMRDKLRASGPSDGVMDAEIVSQINAASWQESFKDSRVRLTFKKWSDCMAERGYRYPDPMASNNDPKWREGAAATSTEKNVAVQDARCKARFNVVGTWYTIDAKIQKVLIAKNLDALTAVKKSIRLRLASAAAVSA